MKKCGRCRQTKRADEFSIIRSKGRGVRLHTFCEVCRQWLKKRNYDPNKQKNRNLIKNYGLTLVRFQEIMAEQHNCCALCGKEFVLVKEPVVDHDHETGLIRGLLHQRCNLIIGQAKDNPELLSQAIAYLARGGKEDLEEQTCLA